MTSARRALGPLLGLVLSCAPLLHAAEPATPSGSPAPTGSGTATTSGASTTGLSPGQGRAPSRDPVEMAADALVARPAGVAATVVGAAIYVVALPFAAIAGDVKETGRVLVGGPARWTFKRPLGQLDGI